MTLEDYLADQYNRDLQDIEAIEDVLDGVAQMFVASFDQTKKCWPYDIRGGAEKAEGQESLGTSAMILAAIGKMTRYCTLRDGSISEKLIKTCDKIPEIYLQAVDKLSGDLKGSDKITSGTFGDNDPITISHLTELARGQRTSKNGDSSIEKIINNLPEVEEKIRNLISNNPSDEDSFTNELDGMCCPKNSFVALRVIRAYGDLNTIPKVGPITYKNFFESQLHDQLSFSSIPDSRFDPAELAFCLEGLLLCAREAVDPALFQRVFAVLAAEQETSAYWRPNRPFAAERTGKVMLPLSVEGANSLLRSVEIMDKDKLYGTFTATAVPLFRRFWQWLGARKVEMNALGTICTGWHSEHINEADVIDLWDTSQVVEFLIAFRKLLQRHIARETLVLSGVKIDKPKPNTDWSAITLDFEPIRDKDIASSVFEKICSDFIEPWTSRSPTNYSILLYGPPGTGKTTVAKSIASALDFRLITVTVSDFLGAGGALVEARAKALFQMLEAQTDCVILFDEIDAFLLDRDSEHYKAQSTLFQFLTPGMLTKINDLRKAKRSIFIVATNFENRIDPAIKRPGRIDKRYLLLPPDLIKREKIIWSALPDHLKHSSDAEISDMAKASLYLGYEAIVGAINGESVAQIIEALKDTPPSSSPEHYLVRLTQETTFPVEEFVALVKMAEQAGRLNEVQADLDALAKCHKETLEKALSRYPRQKNKLSETGLKL